MNKYNLSFVVATRNKKAFLQNALNFLIKNVLEDEEIIVIDGASTDGSAELIESLYKEGKIHQFLSEPDKGEAHAFNKGFLLARGELIKLISDDDVFYYPGINACKDYMLKHKNIDILSTEGGGTNLTFNNPIGYTDYFKQFKKWKNYGSVFSFCGLGLLIRKSSLPLIGLFNTSITSVDTEFTFRIVSIKLNFAWYTGHCWARIYNSKSNSATLSEAINIDLKKLGTFYCGKSYIPFLMKFRLRINRIKKSLRKDFSIRLQEESYVYLEKLFGNIGEQLIDYNHSHSSVFLN